MRPEKSARTYAKRSFGQNFLVDPSYITRIVDSVAPEPDDIVVEIGPGRGAITSQLIGKVAKLIAIEVERDMIAALRVGFGDRTDFELIEQDVLKTDLAALAKRDPDLKNVKLVGNLPFYISTAVLQQLIELGPVFSKCVLMFQREVVDRITADPGNSDRGFLTVITEAYMHTERLFDVPPAAFRPAPKVWSSVVSMRSCPGPDNFERFRRLVSTAFLQKRKTLFNNLKSEYPEARELIVSAGIDPARRAESLSLDEWKRLDAALADR